MVWRPEGLLGERELFPLRLGRTKTPPGPQPTPRETPARENAEPETAT